jgi:hypothetical protein
MNRLFHTFSTLSFVFALLFANTGTAFASGEGGGHSLEVEVNGYHVSLSSQNEWVKGENTVLVTLTDEMGMAVSNADVEILIAPKSAGHNETNSHDTEPQTNSMPGMDMGTSPTVEEAPAHEEEAASPVPMMETDEHGMYMLDTQFGSSGEHTIQVFFHVNGEMLQADFIVDVTGASAQTVILWGFVTVNVGLVTSAGILKKQTVSVKGGK